ncbi:predicted protein [Lichtheimia corymbifera JMRC:FSU:9682]|uniref:Uncharacterized protein n=1 Tax=Lichtheimia corymbifera JMRC:FSU:9682 TaxID=1263082 RepID=A0A068RZU0_9FUNG|nr:predicted protein [Lichtheimia corymbifera JMRC:FSU:9682]
MFVDQSQLLEFIPDTWMRTTSKIMMAMDTISMAAGSSSSAPKRRRSLAPSCNATSAPKMAYNDLAGEESAALREIQKENRTLQWHTDREWQHEANQQVADSLMTRLRRRPEYAKYNWTTSHLVNVMKRQCQNQRAAATTTPEKKSKGVYKSKHVETSVLRSHPR